MNPVALIVDDNIDLAENLREILEDEGWTCETVNSGEAALERLNKQSFDVVITDMKMEGMSGLDVLRSVSTRWPQTPVIVVTAYTRERTVEAAHQEGAIEVLSKPVDLDTLLDTVKRLIESKSRVLLVEDEDELRSNLVEIFDIWSNFSVAAVATQQEALSLINENEFDVIIIDIRLPDGDGIQLAQTIQQRLGSRCPAFLFTSAYADEIGKVAKELTGCSRYVLPKPFSPGLLISLVRRAG